MTRWLAPTLAGCAAAPGGLDRATPSSIPLEATAEPSAHVPAVMVARWTLPGAGRSAVEWGLEPGVYRTRTPEVEGAEVAIPVLGLPAGREVYWRATSDVDGAVLRSEEQMVHVPVPARFPALAVSGSASPSLAGGFVLGAVSTGFVGEDAMTSVGIWRVDDGAPVWWVDLPAGTWVVSPSLSRDGREVLIDAYPQDGLLEVSELVAVALDGSTRTVDRLESGHHAAIEVGPGRWAWLSARLEDLGGPYLALTDRVLEVDRGSGGPPEVRFDLLAELEGVPPLSCVHNVLPTPFVPDAPAQDWGHTNSLVHVEASDALYAYSRYLDALWKIDRASGRVTWQLGGEGSDFAVDGGPLWSHGHLSDVWEGGALVFDNGDHYQPRRSSVVEVAWEEGALTAEEVWRYPLDPADYVPVLGDARRVDDDHVLVAVTTRGRLEEVDRDGHVSWTGQLPGGLQVSRVRVLSELALEGRR